MATVDLERWKIEMEHWKKQGYWPANGEPFPTSPQGGLWHDCTWAMRLDALIRRVERLTVALTQAEYDLCHFYDEPATHDKPIFQIRSEMREALKEKPDSVG